jgi:hypothetical protein
MDSLYDYKDVELIAKPVKPKYQAGGALPFVGWTPTFGTSEAGAPRVPQEDKKKDDSKKKGLNDDDIFALLKDIDGLPSDIDKINEELNGFVILDKLDPLKLDSSSNISARYSSLLSLVKKAKINRQWYDDAYKKLRDKGSLNELAIDSSGRFIGMNADGEFERFTTEQISNKELGDFQLLTNSNLLDIRA